ncbi:g5093 [Coccomyxa viridis]|uniref:G5093 protein n=1 Tax=Coccomyxa viridis TaxID=1274662 RepID=A0ABP1FYU2_9CHLO
MFFQTVPGSNPGISRPFIVGLVMLLLFLSMQTEWTPGNARQSAGKSISSPSGTTPSAAEARESMKEKVILDLSLNNERLERENARLKQHVLDLRRAARACGCDLNTTEADAAAAYPELGEVLGLATGEVAALAPAPDHAQIHRPERHRQHALGETPERRHRYRRLLRDRGNAIGHGCLPIGGRMPPSRFSWLFAARSSRCL